MGKLIESDVLVFFDSLTKEETKKLFQQIKVRKGIIKDLKRYSPKGLGNKTPREVFVYDTALEKKTVFKHASLAAAYLGVSRGGVNSAIQRKSLIRKIFKVGFVQSKNPTAP